MIPMVIKDEKHPIINVGAVSLCGLRSPFSQYGNQLDRYAIGHDITGQRKTDMTEAKEIEGTSYAAPQMAGLIATYLSFAPISDQWKSLPGYKRVEAIKNYLMSDKSSWVRKSNTDTGEDLRVICNGAEKEDHKSVGANPGRDSATAPARPVNNQIK
ncbi:hypothetical protein EK21DRAFT_118511 [Setomelanomma holmii]|uniref:Peptidase S8/S53 domain-containing protein n=1 Tax=Setomelanomma holmii TaxID=210430 RepID=A0A9P4LFY1_9PLEO|nr:hypothetical protein EK21DRAFT_118511 [Setomelanomma holmii]